MKKKKCQWKRVVSILLSAILVFIPNVTALADGTESEIVSTEISKAIQVQEMEVDFDALWEYEINDIDQTIFLTRYIGEATDVVVPANINIEGKEYSVIVDASGTFKVIWL